MASPRKIKTPKSSGADRRRYRGDADANRRRHANSRQQNRSGQRQLHLPEHLPRSHPHASRGLDNRRVDLRDPGASIPQNGQQGVQRERHDGRAGPDAADPRHRDQESKEREARNRLHDIGGPDHPALQLGAGDQRDAKRQIQSASEIAIDAPTRPMCSRVRSNTSPRFRNKNSYQFIAPPREPRRTPAMRRRRGSPVLWP